MAKARPPSSRRPRPAASPRVLLGGLVVLVVVLGAMALGPYGDYTAARGRVEALAGEQQQLLEAVDGLESERERLQDPAALEEEARRELGLTRPGEIPYIVVNPPTEPPAPVRSPLQDQPAEPAPSLISRLLDTVTGWID